MRTKPRGRDRHTFHGLRDDRVRVLGAPASCRHILDEGRFGTIHEKGRREPFRCQPTGREPSRADAMLPRQSPWQSCQRSGSGIRFVSWPSSPLCRWALEEVFDFGLTAIGRIRPRAFFDRAATAGTVVTGTNRWLRFRGVAKSGLSASRSFPGARPLF